MYVAHTTVLMVHLTNYEMRLGASIVKCAVHDPCLVFTENHSKLYTNFESCEEKNDRHFKNMLIYKSQPNYDDQKTPTKVYIF